MRERERERDSKDAEGDAERREADAERDREQEKSSKAPDEQETSLVGGRAILALVLRAPVDVRQVHD